MTAVPSPSFSPVGFIAPPESAILTGVLTDYNAAFGGGLNIDQTNPTPQLQQATSLTAIIGDKNDQFVLFTNLVDPAFSYGRFQDAIARIYFLTRNPAEPTLVQATCVGLAGTIIPAGARAQDATSGQIYTSQSIATIGGGGSVVVAFACVNTGPIACGVGDLSIIYQQIPGWDTISNSSEGVLGNNVESRADFEFRRQQSVQGNATGIAGAVMGAVFNVNNVTDVYAYNNNTGSSQTVQGVTIAASSIYVCVNGGADQDVAQAILSKIGGGCAMTGSTSVTALDNNPLYVTPPSYTIKFQRPASQPIIFAVTLKNNAGVPSNVGTLVDNAIINAFAGADGGSRARIGSTIFASRFYAGIAALGTWAEIESVLVGSANNASSSFTGVIAGTALTVSSVTGTIAIGQTVVGAGVLDGTTIVSGSGTSWVVSQTQTVSSEPMSGVVANLNLTVMQINQAPTVTSPNITTTLV